MMSPTLETRTVSVALVGNPNTGKSTLFSGLVGVHQHVGNYPGVTVEKKTGHFCFVGRRFELTDLPGLYSLAPRSRDEMVVVDLLLGRRADTTSVDAVVCVVDASNLQRNLYLVSQVLELGLPAVLAVNMLDVAKSREICIDLSRLERQLGIPVVPIQASRQIGLSELKAALARAVADRPNFMATEAGEQQSCRVGQTPLPAEFEAEAIRFESELASRNVPRLPRCLVRRLLLDPGGYLRRTLLSDADGHWERWISESQMRLAKLGCPVPAVETSSRYAWAARVLEGVVAEPKSYRITATDRIDHLLTHRVWGTLVFAAAMLLMFQAVFVWAQPLMEGIDAVMGHAGHWISARMTEGALRSLLVDGVIGGVGAVFAFLPQIFILFGFLALLEDCGYMARTAYLMDRLMVRVGLSGKSFIPLLSSFACAVPGVMAARVIENERDRLTTILVAPLLTCSARLPVYALLIAAFIPPHRYWGGLLNLQGLTLAALYLLGIIAAVVFALIFKRTILRGAAPPFVMELPSYKWPSPRIVVLRMVERGWIFVRCAGTLILAVSILVWAALYYPHDPDASPLEQQRKSFLGQAGQIIEPAVKPLGWDWRIGCAVIASLPARELVVATMGVMYNFENDNLADSEEAGSRWSEKLRAITWEGTNRPVFNVPVALSIMVFFALCAQCAATLAVIRRETNSWRWPAFTFAYMTALAYVAAMLTYQAGMLLSSA